MDQNYAEFLETLGQTEEPMGVFYTDAEPAKGFSPKQGVPISHELEQRGEMDWGGMFANFGCVMGQVWLARKKKTAAYFDSQHYGCPGGSFYLGFHKPQLEFISHYVSTGLQDRCHGELYVASPEAAKNFFEAIDPRPAPARYCVIKPVSQFEEGEKPEVVTFFGRGEALSGLHFLSTFVTGDIHVVAAPFGAGCSHMVTWPLHYLAKGQVRAIWGGFDPSARKFHKADEMTFSVPYELFAQMLEKWRESFLTTETWAGVKKKILKSREAWGE